MKLKYILPALIISLISLDASAAKKSRKSSGRNRVKTEVASKKQDASKSSAKVVIAPAEDEESEMSFFEKAWLNVRDDSPFSFRPTYSAEELRLNPLAAKMVDYAASYLGTRYRLGATGPQAFDCSGFTGWIYRRFGMNLERTSRSQFTQGRSVNVDELQPGDLLFFSSRSSGPRNVGHVAMVVSVDHKEGTCEFIHASTRRGVVYQSFPDNAYYSKHFLGARRMLGTEVSAQASL